MAPKARKRVRAGRSRGKATKPRGRRGIRRPRRRARARAPKHGLNLAKVEQLIFKYTNGERTLTITKAVKPLTALSTAARGHARWMARTNTLSHTGRGGSDASSRITSVDSKLSSCLPSENVGEVPLMIATKCSTYYTRGKRHFCDKNFTRPVRYHDEASLAKAIVKAWMNSSGHRANILYSNSRYLGVGAAIRTAGSKLNWLGFFVQNFSQNAGP